MRGLRKQRRADQDEREHRYAAVPWAGGENGSWCCVHGLGREVRPSDSIRDGYRRKAASANPLKLQACREIKPITRDAVADVEVVNPARA